MSQRNDLLYKFYHLVMTIPPVLYWRRRRKRLLTDAEKNIIVGMLAAGYYVILTGTKGHWSSWLVQVATFVREGILTHYSHSLMNCDFIDDPAKRDEFKFIEATAATGSHYATFDEVFEDVDHVCLLTPSTMENEDWTAVIDGLVLNNGKPYDDLAHRRDWEPFDRSVDIRVARLRKKIERDPTKPQVIKTIPGAGYMYASDGR